MFFSHCLQINWTSNKMWTPPRGLWDPALQPLLSGPSVSLAVLGTAPFVPDPPPPVLGVATPLQGAPCPSHRPHPQATPLHHPDLCPMVVSPEKLPLSLSQRLPILLASSSAYHLWLLETIPACVPWFEVGLPLSRGTPRGTDHFLSHLPCFSALGSMLCTSKVLSRSLLNEWGYRPELKPQMSNIQAEQAMGNKFGVMGWKYRATGLYTGEEKRKRACAHCPQKSTQFPQEATHAWTVHTCAQTVPVHIQAVHAHVWTVYTHAQTVQETLRREVREKEGVGPIWQLPASDFQIRKWCTEILLEGCVYRDVVGKSRNWNHQTIQQ